MSEPLSARKITDPLQKRAWRLGFYGLCRRWPEVCDRPDTSAIIELEEQERRDRSLERRVLASNIGRFKQMADFDWAWPDEIDRAAIQDLLTLSFVSERLNPVLIGPNGVGKTMISKNIAYRALMAGHSVLFTSASKLLGQLAETDSPSKRRRQITALGRLDLLCIDEVGHLTYDSRFADLLYEVVNERYEQRPTLISTNRPFREWDEIFPGKATTVTIIERLTHRSEIVKIVAKSYRHHESEQAKIQRATERAARQKGG